MEKDKETHPMFCDPETGICEIPETNTAATAVALESKNKPVKLIYFTDPICSSCWGIEPQLKKLKLEYGEYFDLEYRMGGLLKSWNSYGGSDVANPKEVAKHWDEASKHYKMPIDGNVWLEDPLDSSYPPSIAFKAAQLQSEEKAVDFMRKLREMLFLKKKNITKWQYIQDAAQQAGLDPAQLKTDFDGPAARLFEEDLKLRQQLGVRGFPSIFFTDKEDNRFLVYGSKSYKNYEDALLKLFPEANKIAYNKAIPSLLKQFETLATMEFALLLENSFEEAEVILENLNRQNKLQKLSYRNGELWKLKIS